MRTILKGVLAIVIIGVVFSFLISLAFLIVPIIVIIVIIGVIVMFFQKKFHNTSNSNNICQTTINGKTYATNGDCQSFVYKNGKIFINGKEQDGETPNVGTIVVNGNIEKLETDSSVTVTGNVGSINAGGSVNCDDVKGNISAGGSVNCDDVSGSITAGGSVCSN